MSEPLNLNTGLLKGTLRPIEIGKWDEHIYILCECVYITVDTGVSKYVYDMHTVEFVVILLKELWYVMTEF